MTVLPVFSFFIYRRFDQSIQGTTIIVRPIHSRSTFLFAVNSNVLKVSVFIIYPRIIGLSIPWLHEKKLDILSRLTW